MYVKQIYYVTFHVYVSKTSNEHVKSTSPCIYTQFYSVHAALQPSTFSLQKSEVKYLSHKGSVYPQSKYGMYRQILRSPLTMRELGILIGMVLVGLQEKCSCQGRSWTPLWEGVEGVPVKMTATEILM